MPADLPRELVDAMRLVALQTVQHYAAPRAELDALRQVVMARLCLLTVAERADLALLLPALAELRPDTWVTAAEVLALAPLAQGPAGNALRTACARVLGCPAPARALGKFLGRCIGMPASGLFLERIEAGHRRDSALYRVAGNKA